MNTNDYLRQYYEGYDEDGRLLTRPGRVEFETTMRYITRYLQPGMRILEIGAGTGRYSHALARSGYAVDAVELVQHNIDQFLAHTAEGENVTVRQGSACDLSFFLDDSYDMTLLLGPMYHLFTENEKRAALSEAIRVTKHGGIVFVAYCMADAAILHAGFIKGRIHELIEKSMLNPETFETFSHPWDLFELYRTEEIAALRSRFDVIPLHFVSADGYANHMRAVLESMDDAAFDIYLRYHFSTCERTDMIGLSNHTLDIFRKI